MSFLLAAIVLWFWDKPIEGYAEGQVGVWQAFVCRQKVGDVYRGCFAYAPAGHFGRACPDGWGKQARADHPGEVYVCSPIWPEDEQQPMGLR